MSENHEPGCELISPHTSNQVRIGVMGSAGGELGPLLKVMARELGRAIADAGCCLLTGACPGLPHEAVLGAKEKNGHVVGISPATTLKEHVEVFQSPYKEYDIMIFTGLGLMGRELINIRTSDIIIIVGGRAGTLGEFAIAYEEGKIIGVLEGSGGVADHIKSVENDMYKETGSRIIYDKNPLELTRRVLAEHFTRGHHCDCYPAKQTRVPG